MNLQFFQTLPNPPDDPADDVTGMQTNSASAFAWPTVDHFGYKTNLGGYHSVIHQPTGNGTQNMTRSGASASYTNQPATIANTNQVVAGQYTTQSTASTTDTQLFNITGNGIITQLTGSLTGASNGTDGWQWLGGILIQWGNVSFSGPASDNEIGAVTFKDRVTGAIPFPNNLYSVNCTLIAKNSGVTTASNTISISSIGRTNFSWVFNSSSSSGTTTYPGFYWIAIGN